MADPHAWWREGVLYQVYPRSFADSDGDGHGDLPGLVSRLDHLEWLGVDGIWLNPTMPSPNADWGYDVADYRGVHPDFGTVEDLERLIAEAGARGIRVLLDLVPNHTSIRNPWFVEARGSRSAPTRDWYLWADPKPRGGPPNNWRSVFGGPSWTLDDATGQYYRHSFLPEMPDLDWWNDHLRAEFDSILDFWFARGVAGFRIDVAHRTVTRRVMDDARGRGYHRFPPADVPATHALLRRWRQRADAWDPPRLLVGETYVMDVGEMAAFYGRGDDELHLAFNFPFVFAGLGAPALRRVVDETERRLPAGAWPVWTLSNHDAVRFPTRWCEGDERKVRCGLLLLLTVRGTPFLYYGDEIGMEQVDVPPQRVLDPVGKRMPARGRDGCRTPMQWNAEDGAGFTRAGVEPWLPFGDHGSRNVERQRDDPASLLHLCRDLIAVRRASGDLRSGAHRSLAAPPGVLLYRRGEATVVALNLSRRRTRVRDLAGRVALATDRTRDGERVDGALTLEPWSGAVVTRTGGVQTV